MNHEVAFVWIVQTVVGVAIANATYTAARRIARSAAPIVLRPVRQQREPRGRFVVI